MADEKILEEEVLDEEELDGVAGGTRAEMIDDYKRVMNMGFPRDLAKAFGKIGNALGVNLKVSLNLEPAWSSNSGNKYYIDNELVSRKEFWSFIDEGIAANDIKF